MLFRSGREDLGSVTRRSQPTQQAGLCAAFEGRKESKRSGTLQILAKAATGEQQRHGLQTAIGLESGRPGDVLAEPPGHEVMFLLALLFRARPLAGPPKRSAESAKAGGLHRPERKRKVMSMLAPARSTAIPSGAVTPFEVLRARSTAGKLTEARTPPGAHPNRSSQVSAC